MSDINRIYKEFEVWCKSNPRYDLDVRLHTHGGPLEHGGYISHEKTRIAFAAYRAGINDSAKALEPYAWSLEGVDSEGIKRRYELRDAETAHRHKAENLSGGRWQDCRLIPLFAISPNLDESA